MTEQEKIIESLEQRVWKIMDELGVDIEFEMEDSDNNYRGTVAATIICCMLDHLFYKNNRKCPDTEGVVNPVITSEMVDWFREARNWYIRCDEREIVVEPNFEWQIP